MRVVLLALLMLAVTPVSAEWAKVEENDSATFYLDPATIREDGDLRRVWQMQDLKERTNRGVLSRKILFEYDCKGDKSRILSFTSHSGPMVTGNILTTNTYTDGPWDYAAPDTINATLLSFVCAK